MKLQDIFDEMELQGWNLYDFKAVYDWHKDYMLKIIEDAQNDIIYEDEQVWLCQFMYDFLDALENQIKKEK